MTKTKYLKSGTRRRTKKNKTKRGGMMKSMQKKVRNMFVEKPLSVEQKDLFDNIYSLYHDKKDELLKYTYLNLLEKYNIETDRSKKKIIEDILKKIILSLSTVGIKYDKLIKMLIQFPDMFNDLTDIYKHVIKLYKLYDLIIGHMSVTYRDNLLNDLLIELKTKRKLNVEKNVIIKKNTYKETYENFIKDLIKTSNTFISSMAGINTRIALENGLKFIIDSDMYEDLKQVIMSSNKYNELKNIIEEGDKKTNLNIAQGITTNSQGNNTKSQGNNTKSSKV